MRCSGVQSSSRRRGTVLIVTMLVTFALAGTVLVLCRSMRVETLASANLAASFQASAIERGAEQYVMGMLSQQADSIHDVSEDQFAAVPVGEGYFWIVRPDFNDSSLPTFGLVDESAKVNLNSGTSSFDQLSRLPGMTYTAASSIMDWKDEDTTLERDGAESEYYLALQPEGYYCKDANFETIEELLLVRGVDRLMLYGDGTAPPLGTHSDMFSSASSLNDPDLTRGIYDLVTVYSAEPNTTADGRQRILVSVSRSDRPKMREQLKARLRERLTTARADAIVALVGDNRLHDAFEMYLRCKMTPEELDKVADDIGTVSGNVLRGRINVNTAPRQVLACLAGLDDVDISKLIAARPANIGSSTSIAWIVQALGQKAVGLGAQITTKSFQYSADIVAATSNGRAFKHVRVVVDMRSGTPQIVYRRDLTQNGWPMDRQILASLRAGQGAGMFGMTNMGGRL